VIKEASSILQTDKDIWIAAVQKEGYSLIKDVSRKLQMDEDLWIAAVQQDGNCLQHAPEEIRKNKEVVIAAARKTPAALKYGLDGMNQDGDCLKASSIWDQDQDKAVYSRTERAILKNDTHLQHFKTYNPNAWCQDSCDPNFTDMPYRRVQYPDSGQTKPCATSCWRFAVRFHQQLSKETNGFMIQVEERNGLGDGQKIETKMAKEVGIKVFRTYTNEACVGNYTIARISGCRGLV